MSLKVNHVPKQLTTDAAMKLIEMIQRYKIANPNSIFTTHTVDHELFCALTDTFHSCLGPMEVKFGNYGEPVQIKIYKDTDEN